jgi:LmbE family N-acetylglucosaminyl deacetylase
MNVLAVGAHPDDIELGCGGTLLAHRARGDQVALLVMTTGERGPQGLASRVREQEEASAIFDAALFWGGFQDGAVPENRDAVEVIDFAIAEFDADIVYAHAPHDTHQDHRAASIATLAGARRVSRVLTYETPTSLNFQPCVYVDIGPFLEGKLTAIRAHTSQVLKNRLIDTEAVEAQARYRGFEARVAHGRAEAFGVARFLWDLVFPGPELEPLEQGALELSQGVTE